MHHNTVPPPPAIVEDLTPYIPRNYTLSWSNQADTVLTHPNVVFMKRRTPPSFDDESPSSSLNPQTPNKSRQIGPDSPLTPSTFQS
ncbi:unnamed protein product [Rhizophagus irregularis]|uniref:Uncharacterized protein n=1 Tax=Rhizophagus irregularis (strain DAOM 197198w) TaxID=1432141 RepID=A0A015JW04_RHIIW|nr:hypothetical protein RirG_077810 [Rhizophagus irregularis DAOM 197198w]UZO16478.1 hypothetical protein OCT59_007865 [Rhizophagus irregularis]GBC14488.1 hypothetical protein RIR_jg11441.t1 [Rhizophagus irregularis DAOM 181602=DAOM 197198]CAB4426000.1 unnamed protein product [Rhizophagus irregularis]